jgi:hypothetical protein
MRGSRAVINSQVGGSIYNNPDTMHTSPQSTLLNRHGANPTWWKYRASGRSTNELGIVRKQGERGMLHYEIHLDHHHRTVEIFLT